MDLDFRNYTYTILLYVPTIGKRTFEPQYLDYEYFYDDRSSRQLQLDTSLDLSITEKVSTK